jgi:hypothetical protein
MSEMKYCDVASCFARVVRKSTVPVSFNVNKTFKTRLLVKEISFLALILLFPKWRTLALQLPLLICFKWVPGSILGKDLEYSHISVGFLSVLKQMLG